MLDLRRIPRVAVRGFALGMSAMRIGYLRLAYPGITVSGSFLGPGCEVRAGRGARVDLCGVVIGRGCQIIAAPGARLRIAAKFIGPHSVVAARERIDIGEGSYLAEMTVVRDSDHDRPGGLPLSAGAHLTSSVHIGQDVWLGARATVLRGVSIGDRATVAAGAVVTHDVAPDTTVMGIPARAARL
jgi:acetyltransferase-like isoleucine patch superfamily enzyme